MYPLILLYEQLKQLLLFDKQKRFIGYEVEKVILKINSV